MSFLVYKEYVYGYVVFKTESYSVGDLIKQTFSSTMKCVGKCGGEWVKTKTLNETD